MKFHDSSYIEEIKSLSFTERLKLFFLDNTLDTDDLCNNDVESIAFTTVWLCKFIFNIIFVIILYITGIFWVPFYILAKALKDKKNPRGDTNDID